MKLRAELNMCFMWTAWYGVGLGRSNREQKEARISCFVETWSQGKKKISMLLSFLDLSSWYTKHIAHPSSLLSHEGNPYPKLSGRGISIAAAPLSPTWLSEALYLSPICMIPQTLNTYYGFGTVLLDISVAFEQSYWWINRWMTLIELVILSPSIQFFSFISAHCAPDLIITQTVLVTEYAGNCRNCSRRKWEKSI